ncbi:MAG TPA: DUF1194 domain-containing protein [Acetobacteraceae bacterium]|jgi:hypothetical protein|nr:DUF1194 domain-containing protein [Acetobacteraceae bacterium]
MRWVLALFLVLSVAMLPVPARAGEPVDLALVLVSDVSTSVDTTEYEMQKAGYFAAFTDPDVIAAIRGGTVGAIAVAYVEFATDAVTIMPWTVLRDAASARAFAERLRAAPRGFSGRTSISTGLRQAMTELSIWGGGETLRRVIDVCGDGVDNSDEPASVARDAAVAAGITVNGLAITDRRARWPWADIREYIPDGLPQYYRSEVTGGPGSFVLEVQGSGAFDQAIRRKLLREIASR